MAREPLPAALARIVRAVSGSLELKDIFADVAEAAATILPFDVMAVGRVTGPDTFVVHAIAGNLVDLPRDFRIEDQSPAIRVRPGVVVRFEDMDRELDPRYAFD